MEEKLRLANNFRILREHLGYTQQEIATYLHISQPAYLKYENGSSEISMDNLEKLSQLYNISEYDIMESNVRQMQVCAAFAFRKNGEILNLEQIAQFQKIVTNYIEMSDELEKYNH
jgi:transcriptional regulator with XRE-family HTH domain